MGESINLQDLWTRPPSEMPGEEVVPPREVPRAAPVDSGSPNESGGVNLADLFGMRNTENEPGFFGNVGRALAGGATGTGAAMAGAVEYALGSGGAASRTREYLERQTERAFGSMSQDWQTGMQREFLPGGDGPSAWESPGAFLGALGSQVVASLPSLATTMIPAGLVAKGLQMAGRSMLASTAGAGAVAGALVGAQAGGSVWNGITEAIREASPEELAGSEVYRAARERGLSDPEAREELARAGRTGAWPAIAAAVAAVSGGLLEGPLAANIATGAVRRLAQGFRQGAMAEGREEFIDSGVQEASTQAGLNDALGRPMDASRIAGQAVQGAVVGAAMGGAVGGLVGPRFAPPPPPPPEPTLDPAVAAAAQAAGQQQATPTAASATPAPGAAPAQGAAGAPAGASTAGGVDPAVAAAAGAARPAGAAAVGVSAPGPVTPPPTPQANSASELSAALGGMGAGIGQGLRDGLWQGYQGQGAMVQDPLVLAAKHVERLRGRPFTDQAEFIAFVEAFSKAGSPDEKRAVAAQFGVSIPATTTNPPAPAGAAAPPAPAGSAPPQPTVPPGPAAAASSSPGDISAAPPAAAIEGAGAPGAPDPSTNAQVEPNAAVLTSPATGPAPAEAAQPFTANLGAPVSAGAETLGALSNPDAGSVFAARNEKALGEAQRLVLGELISDVQSLMGEDFSRAEAVTEAQRLLAGVRQELVNRMGQNSDPQRRASVAELVTALRADIKPQIAKLRAESARRVMVDSDSEPASRAQRRKAQEEKYAAERKTDQQRLGTVERERALSEDEDDSFATTKARIKMVRRLIDVANAADKTGRKGTHLAETVKRIIDANNARPEPLRLPPYLAALAEVMRQNAGRGGANKTKRARIDAWIEQYGKEADTIEAAERARFEAGVKARRAAVRDVFMRNGAENAEQEKFTAFRERVARMDAEMTEALGGIKDLTERMEAVDDSVQGTESAAGALLWWLDYAANLSDGADAATRRNIQGSDLVMRGSGDNRPSDEDIVGVVRDLRALAAERATAMGTGGDDSDMDSEGAGRESDQADTGSLNPEEALLATEEDSDSEVESDETPRVEARDAPRQIEADEDADASEPAFRAVETRSAQRTTTRKEAMREALGDAEARRAAIEKLRAGLKRLTSNPAPIEVGARDRLLAILRYGQRYMLTDKLVADRMFTPSENRTRGTLERMIWAAIRQRIGDNTPVVFVPDTFWDGAWGSDGEYVNGVFVPNTTDQIASGQGPGIIMLPERMLRASPERRTEVILHEGLHAASTMSVERISVHRSRIARMSALIKLRIEQDPDLAEFLDDTDVQYAFSEPGEFFAMALTNRTMQDIMSSIELSPEEARFLGLTPNLMSSITDAFKAFVDMIRKMLGLSPDTMTALEAAVRLTDKAVQTSAQQRRTAQRDLRNGEIRDRTDGEDPPAPVMAHRTMGDSLDKIGKGVAKAMRDRATNAQGWASFGMGWMTLRQIEEVFSPLFERTARLKAIDPNTTDDPLTQATKALNERAQIAQKFVEDQFMGALNAMNELPAAQRAELDGFLIDVTMTGVHPDVPISDNKNKHLHKSKKASALQAKAMHPRLEARYKAMTKEQRAAYHKVVDTTARVHKRIIQDTVEDIIHRWWGVQVDLHLGKNKVPLPMSHAQMEAMAQRFRDGTETAADTGVLDSSTTDESWSKLIKQARDRATFEGPYIPLQRTGDFVVSWKEQPDSTMIFATEQQAKDYAESSVLPVLSSRAIYRDAQGNEITSPDPAVQKREQAKRLALLPATATNTEKLNALNAGTKKAMEIARKGAAMVVHEVVVQNQGVSYFRTLAEAQEFREAMIDEGKDSVKAVDLREDPQAQGGFLDDALNRVLGQVAKDKTLSAKARAELELSLSNALTQLTPNRLLASHLIKRRRVLGADRNVSHVLANYATGSANYHAAVQTTVPIASAMRAMEEWHREAKAGTAGQADDGSTLRRAQAIAEVRRRVNDSAYDPSGRGSTSPIIRRMQSFAYIFYLASPAYSMIQMMQPYMFTAPVLAARFGAARGSAALARAMNDIGMGKVLKGGAKDTATTFRTLMTGKVGTPSGDMLEVVKDELKRQPDGSELNAMLDELAREGLVDSSSGLELVRSLKDESGRFGTKLNQAEAFARALPAAIEVINRTGTAVAAYRLARQSGQSVPEARATARRIVDQTQADYSSANTARYMDPKFAGGFLAPLITFRKFAQAVYFLLVRQTYLAVKGKTKEERRQALRTLGYVLLTHQIMAGSLGLPTEPLSLALGLVGFMLGGEEPPDWESEVRKVMSDMFGTDVAEVLMRGLPRAINLDLSGRVGLNSLVFIKDLRDYESKTLTQYAGDIVLGAPGAMVASMLQAPRLIADGDYGKAAEAVLPKGLRDVAKAMRFAEEGITTRKGERIDGGRAQNAWEVGLQALGFQPGSTGEVYERRNAVQGEYRRLNTERTDLMREWRQAKPAERAAIWRDQIQPWNQNLPAEGRQARITMDSLLRSLTETQRRAKASGQQDYLPRGYEWVRREGRFANTQ